jgi:branched-subunit amino acid transport protein AzlD
MINTTQSLFLILVMALVTIALRFLPFLLFPSGDKIPAPMLYLSKVLPCAVMGMLVVYCLKNVTPLTWPYALPEALAIIFIVLLQIWKHNTLLSILLGTVVYMFLLQTVFCS